MVKAWMVFNSSVKAELTIRCRSSTRFPANNGEAILTSKLAPHPPEVSSTTRLVGWSFSFRTDSTCSLETVIVAKYSETRPIEGTKKKQRPISFNQKEAGRNEN
eukprot:TRINITY_DN7705_c0_g1_i1.p1 TRINITY_DN7705_c0_g1~~TRINITY_DN7705_c0_g1_i1.p1  ORF type:complete len:104 (+),score=6.98 TRINITY_DN7705_c0_g1_i1:336-647(+)